MTVEPIARRHLDVRLETRPEWTDPGDDVVYEQVGLQEFVQVDQRSQEQLAAVPTLDALFVGVKREDYELVPLPEELVLRELLNLDSTDPEAVVDFWRQFGGPSVGLRTGDEYAWAKFRFARIPTEGVQRLARHWLAHKKGQDVRTAWVGDSEIGEDVEACWRAWARAMAHTVALAAPIVRVESEGGFDTGQPEAGRAFETAAALQLARLVHEDPRLRACKNESCDYQFFRQRGRAMKGQHRTKSGVEFCSARCASTQASRAHRRRTREQGL